MKKCVGCFESLRDDLDICPFCGYYDGSADSSVYLVPGTLLSGRYKIGNLIESDETSVKYLAYDTSTQLKVEIKEFFPKGYVTRDSDSSNVKPKDDFKSQFDNGFQLFVDEAKRLFSNSDGAKIYDCIAENNTAYMILEHAEVNVVNKYSTTVPNETKPVQEINPVKMPVNTGKNKKNLGVIVVVAAVIVVLLVGALIAIPKLSTKLAPSSFIYLADGDYFFKPYSKSKDNINFASPKSDDYKSGQFVYFSPDGKYVYYYTKFDEDERVGTLCRIEVSKIKSNANFDKYIENIASNVRLGLNILDNGFVLFEKDEDTLCCYNGKEVIKISNEVINYYISEDEKQMIYLLWDYDNDSYALYGCYMNKPDEKIKLAKNVSSVPTPKDFDNILYHKENDDGETSLYVVGFNKESEKIANNAKYITAGKSCSYYIVYTGSVSLYDYVKDSNPDSYNYYREVLQDEYYDQSVFDIYRFENGKSTQICSDVISFRIFSGGIAYKTKDMVNKKIDIDEIEYLDDVINLLTVNYSEPFNILVLDSDTIIPMTEQGLEILESDDEYYRPSLYVISDKLFLLNDSEELYVASISKNSIGHFDLIAEDVFYTYESEGSLYYRSGLYEIKDNDFYDQYVYKDGKSVRLAWDCSSPDIYEDNIVIAETDIFSNSKRTVYEITMFYPNGNKNRIADDVSWYVRVDNKTILYISDGDLYSYNGKESTRIAVDVDYVWCSKVMDTV